MMFHEGTPCECPVGILSIIKRTILMIVFHSSFIVPEEKFVD